MIITLVSNDIDLQKKLKKTGYFDEVHIVANIEDVKPSDVLLVSDEMIGLNTFIYEYETKISNICKAVYYSFGSIYEINHENMMQIMRSKKIKYLAPGLTNEQITERLIQEYVPNFNKRKNIATFFGTDAKVGTTMVAQCTAEMLARNTELKICLLFLSGSPSIDYIEHKECTGIDYLKAKIMNNVLTGSDLIDTCIHKGNLYILPGTDSILFNREYHPEHIEYLINTAAQEFGAVIIDAGHNIDSAMALSALNATTNKYLVTTQHRSSKERFDRVNNQVLKLLNIKPQDFYIVINKYIDDNIMPAASKIADLYGGMYAGHIPYMDMSWQAEEENKSLLNFDDKFYAKSVYAISDLIAQQTNIAIEAKKPERKGLFKFMGGLRRVSV